MKKVCDFDYSENEEYWIEDKLTSNLHKFAQNLSLKTEQFIRMRFYLNKYVKFLGFNFKIGKDSFVGISYEYDVDSVYQEKVEKAMNSGGSNAYRDCILLNICYSLKIQIEEVLSLECLGFDYKEPVMMFKTSLGSKRKVNIKCYSQIMYFHFKSGCDLKKYDGKFFKITTANALRKRLRKPPMDRVYGQVRNRMNEIWSPEGEPVIDMLYAQHIDVKISKNKKFGAYYKELMKLNHFND